MMSHRFDQHPGKEPPVFCTYGTQDEPKLVELTYRDDEIGFLVLLAPPEKPLAEIEAALDGDKVDAMLAKLERCDPLIVELPRFEFRSKLALAPLLSGLGMPSAFDPDSADFSKLVVKQEEPIYLKDVLHEAHVRVDEYGTDASAASIVGSVLLSDPPHFTVDRDFVFFIRDRLTGAILFMGRVSDPSVQPG
jgi:serpin B